MVKLQVLSFCDNRMASRCIVLESNDSLMQVGNIEYVDLTVDAGFGEMPERELIGKIVTVERLYPCEFIGIGVKLDD